MWPSIRVEGILDPERVVLFGYWIPTDKGKPSVAIQDSVDVYLSSIGQDLVPPKESIPYEHVYSIRWWFNEFSEHKTAKVEAEDGRYVIVGLDYLRKALEYFRWVGGATSTWKTMLKNGVVDVYLAADRDAHELPLILVYAEYVAVIAPRLEGLEG